jgi:PAB1-binding protein PBP1
LPRIVSHRITTAKHTVAAQTLIGADPALVQLTGRPDNQIARVTKMTKLRRQSNYQNKQPRRKKSGGSVRRISVVTRKTMTISTLVLASKNLQPTKAARLAQTTSTTLILEMWQVKDKRRKRRRASRRTCLISMLVAVPHSANQRNLALLRIVLT